MSATTVRDAQYVYKINENSQISDYLILTLLFFFRGKENSQKLSIQESLAGIMKLLFTVLFKKLF